MKILVEIFVPVLAVTMEVYIPVQSPVYEALELLKKAVTELSDGEFLADAATTLCYRESGDIININQSVQELELQNGSCLMLI